MSIDSQLIHTCTITRKTTTSLNEMGNANSSESVLASGVRCRLVDRIRTQFVSETREKLVYVEYKLLMGSDVSLRPGDVISNIEIESGCLSVRFKVITVLARRSRVVHHQSALLEEWR